MPNETNNLLQVLGEPDKIKEFIDSHMKHIPDSDGEFYWDFEVSVPIENEDYKKSDNMVNDDNNMVNDDNNMVNDDNNMVDNILNFRKEAWGTDRGIVRKRSDNQVYIDTPWTSCEQWFINMVPKYLHLDFVLKYNDEFCEDFYGWAVSSKGVLLAKEIICLHPHPTPEVASIDIYKYYNNDNNNDNDIVDEPILNSQDEEIVLE